MDVLGYGVAVVLNIFLVSLLARRLLGVPVGWPRTIALSTAIQLGTSGLLRWSGTALDLRMTPSSPHAAQSLLIALLIAAWLFAAQITALAVLEALVPTGTVPSLWAFVRSVPARQRRGLRYTAIVRIAVKHGLGAYLRPSSSVTDLPRAHLAASLRAALVEGGVTFVKLGQMLSARPDLVPPAFVAELSTLQNDVPSRPWSEVKQVLEADLGCAASEVFAHVEETPLAAASVGQVHLATLPNGDAVVVKVQRAEARAQVTADLDIVMRLAAWLERSTDWGRQLGVRDLARDFATSLEEELDYRVELTNMLSVKEAMRDSGQERVTLPTAYPRLSSQRVIVMSRLEGRPVSQAGEELDALGTETRDLMARDLLAAVMHQVMVTGVFHADLHPGNIFVAPDGGIGLLDFGSVGRIDRTARTSLATLLAAFDRQDAVAATNALLDLLDAGPELDVRRLERDLGQLLLRFSGPGTSTSGLFVELFRVVLRHGVTVPGPVALAFRAVGALEGSLRAISPEIDVVTETRALQQTLLGSLLDPHQVRRRVETQLASLLPMLERLPRRLDRISRDLETGELTVSVRMFGDPGDRAFLSGLIQQFVIALLATACTVGGVVLLSAEGGPRLTPVVPLWSFLGFTLLFFAFVLAARILVSIFARPPERR